MGKTCMVLVAIIEIQVFSKLDVSRSTVLVNAGAKNHIGIPYASIRPIVCFALNIKRAR